MKIDEYVKPKSAAEAYALLNGNENAAVVGGGAWLRLSRRPIELAVDLYDAGLDFVRRSGDRLELGAMVSYRRIETDPEVNGFADALLKHSVRDIVGVQMRNIFTVGGTVAGRYGFSHLNCALLALGAEIVFHEHGPMSLDAYLSGEGPKRDIITHIVIDTADVRSAFQAARRVHNDFAMLAVAAARRGDNVRLAVGARPGRARLAESAMAHLASALSDGDAGAMAVRAAELAAEELDFGDDQRASADYRRQICPTLVSRALQEVLS